ncbi:hypothetical protein HPB48_012085 [Haemaphysalis longicornis]|uniref:Uncharacterized protein n=1 Tax=Haemaphysalis longicornis TaxID=44386 RepID=A0A9J6GBJ3_HAELO|nr:hypothetical protein HPB48_012085 [Haemaphysalis longicornis]
MEPDDEKQQANHSHDMGDGTQNSATSDGGSKLLPTVLANLEGKLATVLQDTGCNTVVVKRSLVLDCKLTGGIHTIRLLDRSAKSLQEARVYVDSPRFKGQVLAVCMESPLYQLVLGNFPGVRADPHHIAKLEQRLSCSGP